MKYANELLNTQVINHNYINHKDENSFNNNIFANLTFGLLLKLCLKTGIRASDLLNLEYDQFKEDKLHPNSYNLTYKITKTSTTNVVPVPVEIVLKLQEYELLCKRKYGYTSDKIFFNYRTKKTFTRVWASKKVSVANKKGLLGEVVNVAGMHSIRRAAVVEIFEKNPDLRLA